MVLNVYEVGVLCFSRAPSGFDRLISACQITVRTFNWFQYADEYQMACNSVNIAQEALVGAEMDAGHEKTDLHWLWPCSERAT